MKLRKYSLGWYVTRFYRRNRINLFLILLSIIMIVLINNKIDELERVEHDVPVLIVVDLDKSTEPEPVVVEVEEVEEVEEVAPRFTEEDVVMVASLLTAEVWQGYGDARDEATVIMNRLDGPICQWNNPDGTLYGVIHAGNGRQFNGIWSETFKNREYTDEMYEAAYDVMVNGYRSFGEDILYFANKHTATDREFINSVEWVKEQETSRGHSFGRKK